MQRATSGFLASLTLLALTACGGSDDPSHIQTGNSLTNDAGATAGGTADGGSTAGGGIAGGALAGGGLAGGSMSGSLAGGATAGGASAGGTLAGGTASGGTAGGDGGVSSGGLAGGDGGLPPTTAASCTGKPGMKRGKSSQTMMAGGLMRSFIYYAPKNLDPNKPVPLVIVPHGTNMSGEGMYSLTDYAALADREGVVAIFPDGEDGPGSLVPWNVGQNICGLGAFVGASGDDQSFVNELIKFAQADQCIDDQHIFMTGFSMGGYFSNENGCQNSKIRAVGPHSGGTHDLSACPNKHKPVIVFHFQGDSLIDYECGTGARDQWIKRNGCMASNPDVVTVKGGKCEYFKGCPADGQVAMCTFTEGDDEALPPGHGWSGGKTGGPEDFAAITSTESATELGWAFFKKYAW